MLITPAAIAALQVGFSRIFQDAWQKTAIWWQRVATPTSSSTATNVYGAMSRLPAMREWLGPRMFANIQGHSYTLANRTFELSIGVSREQIEDDMLGWTSPKLQEMGRQAAKWPDHLSTEALTNGNVTTGPGGAGFDGLAMFSASHDLDPAGVQSNNLSLALSPANYATARQTMMAYTGEDSKPLGIMPNLLVVPPQLEYAARVILNADFFADPGGASAPVTNVLKGSADLLVVPELAGASTTWYLMDVSMPILPLIWQVRRPVAMTAKTNLTDENVFRQNRFEWGIDGRGAVGYGPWFLALRSKP